MEQTAVFERRSTAKAPREPRKGAKMRPQIEEVATTIVDSCVRVHRALGPGLLESVYQVCLSQELRDRGVRVDCEVGYPIRYGGMVVETAFRVDMIVEGLVIVENKTVQAVQPVHEAQLLTYLKLTRCRLGFLINWNVPVIREGIRRMVCNL